MFIQFLFFQLTSTCGMERWCGGWIGRRTHRNEASASPVASWSTTGTSWRRRRRTAATTWRSTRSQHPHSSSTSSRTCRNIAKRNQVDARIPSVHVDHNQTACGVEQRTFSVTKIGVSTAQCWTTVAGRWAWCGSSVSLCSLHNVVGRWSCSFHDCSHEQCCVSRFVASVIREDKLTSE